MKLGPLEMTLKFRELKLLNNENMAKSEITKNVDFSKSRKKIWGFSKNTPGECSEEEVYKGSWS